MKRYFFHVLENGQLIIDEEGLELSDLAAARHEATESARYMLSEAIRSGKHDAPDAFVIADEGGQTLDTIPLATVLPRSLRGRLA